VEGKKKWRGAGKSEVVLRMGVGRKKLPSSKSLVISGGVAMNGDGVVLTVAGVAE
jgi:hypothetical protein